MGESADDGGGGFWLRFPGVVGEGQLDGWMATLGGGLSLHGLACGDAVGVALDGPLWGLLAASGATH